MLDNLVIIRCSSVDGVEFGIRYRGALTLAQLHARPQLRVQFRPGLFRIRGNLRLIAAQKELAEADLHEATILARDMGAKAWELRATMSLARLLATQERRDEARSILAEIYGWFTEGFDTAGLKEAKALLEELTK